MNRALDRWPVQLALALLAALPLLIAPELPLIDLGGHIGRYAVQLDGGADPALRQWYGFHWDLLPNLGCDLLVALLGPLMGLEPAVRLIVAATAALHAAGVLLLSRAAHGRVQPTALFALPLVYGLPVHYGFANFNLASALALLLLALWLHLAERGRIGLRAALYVPLGILLWLTHIVGWGIFGICAFACEAARQQGKGLHWFTATYRAALAMLPLTAAPLIGIVFGSGSHAGQWGDYQQVHRKLEWLILALCDRWELWDKAALVALAITAGWFWRAAHFTRHRGLALAAILMLGTYAVMPSTVMGSNYADMRLIPTVLALFLVAARPLPGVSAGWLKALALAGLVFAGARLAGNAISLWQTGNQFRQSLTVLEAVPRGANLLTFHVRRCGADEGWALDRRLHLSGYALARRHAFDSHQWEIPGGQLLRVDNPNARPFDREPSTAVYDVPCGKGVALDDLMGRVPSAIAQVWLIGAPHGFAAPGWSTARRSGDSVVLARAP